MQKNNPFKNKEGTWISYCMPVYNKQHRVRESIMSVITQDYPYTELIVVNDGSSDRSVREIKKAENQMTKEQKSRFKFINYKENKGACYARNLAAKESKGKYLAFLPADAYLYPGVARGWVNCLNEMPEIDFVYGAYRFIDRKESFGKRVDETVTNVYPSKQFDPYLLETTNYIDGTFPIRRELFEKMGGWDESVKSLQDWEYWLRAVKIYGAKGHYIPDVFFETDKPDIKGLSGDSHRNWLERIGFIKKKLGIPERRLCVVAFGAQFHAINIAKILDANFSSNPSFKPHNYDSLYVIGAYPQYINEINEVMRVSVMPNAPVSPARKIIHWIGSDVMAMRELPRKHLDIAVAFYNKMFDEQLCECPHIQKELKDLGIKAKIVPLPTTRLYEEMPLPEKPTIACYQPGLGMKDIYMPEFMHEIAKKMPDTNFIFFGDNQVRMKKKNIKYVPFVDEKEMKELVEKSSLLVRLTIHDGLPLIIPEFVTAGRNVVTNVPLPHIDVVGGDFTIDGVIRVIKSAIKRQSTKEAQDYYRKLMDVKKFKRTIYKLKEYKPREYWDERASLWDKQAKSYLSKAEIKRVQEQIKKLKPKSVIDVGCGNGQWVPYLPENYLGIDISKKMVEIATKKYPDKVFAAVKLEDIKNVGKYDLAFCHTVFLHIPEKNMEQAVKALKGIAKKAIIIEPENAKTINYQHGHDFEKWFDIKTKIPMRDRTLYVVNL